MSSLHSNIGAATPASSSLDPVFFIGGMPADKRIWLAWPSGAVVYMGSAHWGVFNSAVSMACGAVNGPGRVFIADFTVGGSAIRLVCQGEHDSRIHEAPLVYFIASLLGPSSKLAVALPAGGAVIVGWKS